MAEMAENGLVSKPHPLSGQEKSTWAKKEFQKEKMGANENKSTLFLRIKKRQVESQNLSLRDFPPSVSLI